MPSPVGHLLGGAAVYLAGSAARERRIGFVLAITLLGSILPDFDFVPGILIGNMRAFHHGISHSLVFALLFGAAVLPVARRVDATIAIRAAALATVAYTSHVILDFISVNEGTRGVPVLWPLSDEELGVSLHLFGHFRYGDISEGIWSVVRWVNVSPLLREVTILGTLVLALRRKEQIRHAVSVLRNRIANGHHG